LFILPFTILSYSKIFQEIKIMKVKKKKKIKTTTATKTEKGKQTIFLCQI